MKPETTSQVENVGCSAATAGCGGVLLSLLLFAVATWMAIGNMDRPTPKDPNIQTIANIATGVLLVSVGIWSFGGYHRGDRMGRWIGVRRWQAVARVASRTLRRLARHR